MNYYIEILKLLKDKERTASSEKQSAITSMLKHLIEMLGETDFNKKIEAYFINGEEKFDNCFYSFHKSMRQCDFYAEYYQHIHGRDANNKRTVEYESIGGHLDMLFWNLIHVSEIPYLVLKEFLDKPVKA
jgi:hypothetical protein